MEDQITVLAIACAIGLVTGQLLLEVVTWLATHIGDQWYFFVQWIRHNREARKLRKYIANGGTVSIFDDAGHYLGYETSSGFKHIGDD